MRLSLRAKVSLCVTASVVIIGSVITYVFVTEQEQSRERKLVARGTALAFALSKSSEEGLMREDLDIQRTASYIEAGDVLFAQVFLNIWEAADAYPIGKLKEPPNPDAIGHFERSSLPFYSKDDLGYDFYQPVLMSQLSPPMVIGYVRVRLSTAYIRDDINKQLRQSAVISIGLALTAMAMMNAIIGGLLVRPVLALKRSVSKFQNEGAIPEAVYSSSSDEITELSEEFRRMCMTVTDKERALKETNAELSRLYEKMRELSLHDPLTKLANRRHMTIVLGKCFARCERFGNPLSVVIFDIDHFKKYNDEFGHAAGDALLVDVSSTIAKEVRDVDLAVRYGGEEFLVILNEAAPTGGRIVAEKIRHNIALKTGITVSAGVSTFEPWMRSKDDLLFAADMALYRAKETGRNKTVGAEEIALHCKVKT